MQAVNSAMRAVRTRIGAAKAAAPLLCRPSSSFALASSRPASAAAASVLASSSLSPRPASSARFSTTRPPLSTRPDDLYRSPLRNPDDRTYDHLWEHQWVLEAPRAKQAVIWLHGLGQKIENLTTMCEIIAPPHTKFLVPQAPKLGITALPDEPDQNNWFDLLSDKRDAGREASGEAAEEDEFGMEDMAARIHELIRHEMEVAQLEPHQVMLAGFAEGGAMALYAGLSFPERLAGIASVAGYLPLPHLFPSFLSPANAKTPVLAVHGNSDFVVPLAFAKQRYTLLQKEKVPFELRTEFHMGHFITNSSLMSTQQWMADTLKKSAQRAAAEGKTTN